MDGPGHHTPGRRRVRVERGIYLQPNGNYAVCVVQEGRPRFRTIGPDLPAARHARLELLEAARQRALPLAPNSRFDAVAERWLARFTARVAAGERRQRTLDAHRYHLHQHVLPRFGARRIHTLTVVDVVAFLDALRHAGASEKTRLSALGTLRMVLRYAHRQGLIVEDPTRRLEHHERPHPVPRDQRVLGRPELRALLACCPPAHRLLLFTAIFTGMRISEVLGLIWSDIDLDTGVIHVRAQLSVPRRGAPGQRVPTKTRASVREIPLPTPLVHLLRSARDARAASAEEWVFLTAATTAHAQRNVTRRGLRLAAERAGIDDGTRPRLRFHDLRHTFASHLILDGDLDVARVSRILGHAHISTTLDIYTHLFEHARHRDETRTQLAASGFVALLAPYVPAAVAPSPAAGLPDRGPDAHEGR